MKENLYAWIKNLAVFYLLFTMVLHLVPAGKYEKYVRFFMGLLLILILLIPVFTLFGKAEELGESFQLLYDKKEEERKVQEGENLQKMFIWKSLEQQLEEEIAEDLMKKNMKAEKVEVLIEGENVKAVLYLQSEPDQELERRLKDELLGQWGILAGNCQIQVKKINRTQWITLFLVGLLLGVIAVPTEKKTGSDNRVRNAAREEIQEQGNASALEQRLQQVLSDVEGVGKVQVMLMTGNEKSTFGFGNDNSELITGVLIAAQGADDPVTVREIQQAVMALFQVEAHRIKVIKMI